MPEHALQRIVQFVGDAGDELPERRQLLGLGQPLAQLLLLGFEPGLRRQVARHDDAARALAVAVHEIAERHHELALQHRVHDLPGGGRLPFRAYAGRLVRRRVALAR